MNLRRKNHILLMTTKELKPESTIEEFIKKYQLSLTTPVPNIKFLNIVITNDYLKKDINQCKSIIDLPRKFQHVCDSSNCNSCILNINNKKEFMLLYKEKTKHESST